VLRRTSFAAFRVRDTIEAACQSAVSCSMLAGGR